MAFKIRKDAFVDGVEEIRIIPYYDYGICIRIYSNKTYEIWNYETIPLSKVAKAVDNFIMENPAITKLNVGEKTFEIPTENVRQSLFDFLTEIEKSKLEEA